MTPVCCEMRVNITCSGNYVDLLISPSQSVCICKACVDVKCLETESTCISLYQQILSVCEFVSHFPGWVCSEKVRYTLLPSSLCGGEGLAAVAEKCHGSRQGKIYHAGLPPLHL